MGKGISLLIRGLQVRVPLVPFAFFSPFFKLSGPATPKSQESARNLAFYSNNHAKWGIFCLVTYAGLWGDHLAIFVWKIAILGRRMKSKLSLFCWKVDVKRFLSDKPTLIFIGAPNKAKKYKILSLISEGGLPTVICNCTIMSVGLWSF